MFQVGDKVVYPMHGAGVIEAIEEQEILGHRNRYYVMRMPINGMRVMVPCENLHNIGLREVITEQAFQKVLEVLKTGKTLMSKNWNHRYRANMEKIRSGNILELAEVVRALSQRDRRRGSPPESAKCWRTHARFYSLKSSWQRIWNWIRPTNSLIRHWSNKIFGIVGMAPGVRRHFLPRSGEP